MVSAPPLTENPLTAIIKQIGLLRLHIAVFDWLLRSVFTADNMLPLYRVRQVGVRISYGCNTYSGFRHSDESRVGRGLGPSIHARLGWVGTSGPKISR